VIDHPGGAVSEGGRFVSFSSFGTNLVEGDTNARSDVFVRDRQTGTTERVSVASDGAQADGGNSFAGTMSADGRYVTFTSVASNLVAGETNGFLHIYLHDRATGLTERVSVSSLGVQGDGDSFTSVSITPDGRFVPFVSRATNLVTGDTNGFADVFVRDRG
jgi:Tol biopolymer transport system component